MDNPQLYGIRWYAGNPYPMPSPLIGRVATATSFDVNGGISNAALRIGDPITMNSTTGMVTLCQGYEASGNNGNPVLGIVVGVKPYYDAAQNLMVPANALPSDIAWGTVLERQSQVLYVPAEAGIWEIDCDDASTATTEAAYQAFINENCDHTLAGAAGTALNPRLDISQHGTATAQWRILDVSPTLNNRDFTGNYVKLLVRVNEGMTPAFTATGT